jgi:hypothetical protein
MFQNKILRFVTNTPLFDSIQTLRKDPYIPNTPEQL